MNSADLASEVDALVREWWSANEAPLLLSKLGSLLSRDAQIFARVQRIALKRFIGVELPDRLRLVSLPQHGGGVAPLPETSALSEKDLAEALEAYRRRQAAARVPRYHALIWDAFRTPLTEGRRRFVLIGNQDEIELQEIGSESEAPAGEGWIEVLQEHLDHIHQDGRLVASDMNAAIRRWAEGKVETRRLLHRPATSVSATASLPSTPLRGPRHRPGTVDSVIVGLRGFTPDELARIQIPADVILSFLERSSRGQ